MLWVYFHLIHLSHLSAENCDKIKAVVLTCVQHLDGGDVCTFKILFPFGNNAKILQFWLSVLKINMWGLSINDDTNLERRGKDLSKGDDTS